MYKCCCLTAPGILFWSWARGHVKWIFNVIRLYSMYTLGWKFASPGPWCNTLCYSMQDYIKCNYTAVWDECRTKNTLNRTVERFLLTLLLMQNWKNVRVLPVSMGFQHVLRFPPNFYKQKREDWLVGIVFLPYAQCYQDKFLRLRTKRLLTEDGLIDLKK